MAVNCSISEDVFDLVAVRIYSPLTRRDGVLRRGVAYYHGGGWVRGNIGLSTRLHCCSFIYFFCIFIYISSFAVGMASASNRGRINVIKFVIR